MGSADDEQVSPVERVLDTGVQTRRLSSRQRQAQRSLEHYLAGGMRPRWMQRIVEIDRATAEHRMALERSFRALHAQLDGDPAGFAARWRERVAGWRFDEVNALIAQHNEYYPIERDLPMNPRTGEYVDVGGRPFARRHLDAEWVFEQFPAG